jgi:propionyl-CoA carboxylase alpha chain
VPTLDPGELPQREHGVVEEGQEVAVVEAMKMQNVLRAPRKGRVAAVPTTAGQTLAVDQVIVEFE